MRLLALYSYAYAADRFFLDVSSDQDSDGGEGLRSQQAHPGEFRRCRGTACVRDRSVDLGLIACNMQLITVIVAAESLGIKRIIIHRYSSILSAYGLALSDRVHEAQEPASDVYDASTTKGLIDRLDRLEVGVREELASQGFEADKIHVERFLNIRYTGTVSPSCLLSRLNLQRRSNARLL